MISKIIESCQWLEAKKDKRGKPIGKITTQVAWADWERRWFSPMLACLWHSKVDEIGNLRFPGLFENAVAEYLNTTPEWVDAFNYYATRQNYQTIFSICLETGEYEETYREKHFPGVENLTPCPIELSSVMMDIYPHINKQTLSQFATQMNHSEIQRNLIFNIVNSANSLLEHSDISRNIEL